jgi:hypothetical protein
VYKYKSTIYQNHQFFHFHPFYQPHLTQWMTAAINSQF